MTTIEALAWSANREEGNDMAWIPWPGFYDPHKARRGKFLANHPEWQIIFVGDLEGYEASTGDIDTQLVILADRSLGPLMDRLEAGYATDDDHQCQGV